MQDHMKIRGSGKQAYKVLRPILTIALINLSIVGYATPAKHGPYNQDGKRDVDRARVDHGHGHGNRVNVNGGKGPDNSSQQEPVMTSRSSNPPDQSKVPPAADGKNKTPTASKS